MDYRPRRSVHCRCPAVSHSAHRAFSMGAWPIQPLVFCFIGSSLRSLPALVMKLYEQRTMLWADTFFSFFTLASRKILGTDTTTKGRGYGRSCTARKNCIGRLVGRRNSPKPFSS